ncbi:MAG: hypothetical protein WCX22_03395 [Methanoregula sp.]
MTGNTFRASGSEGVSESIGFLLIFTLMIIGIGMVTLYGYPMLMKQQVSADEQIMEKNMIVLQNDIKSLAYKTVPYKETALKIGGGTLTVYNSQYASPASEITIYDDNAVTFVEAFKSGDLMYVSDSAETDISLQNGAVVKRQAMTSGSVMLAEPRWFYDGQTKTMVINLVNLTSQDMISREGIGTVQMALGETRFDKYDNPSLVPIYVDYDPDTEQDYSVAWDNYFLNTLGMTRESGTPGTGTTLTYQLPPTTTLVIKQYEVIIRSL